MSILNPAGLMGTDSPADLERMRALKRMKLVATSLLAVMAVIFVIAWEFQGDFPWLGYVRASAEAGMVGALADWFAVTALFRHPLGLKIPHTAIIPEKKESLGSSLSEFVADNFLNETVVRDKLSRLSLSHRVGSWLARPAGAERVTAEISHAISGLANILHDDQISEMLASTAKRRIEQIQVAPALGKIAGGVFERGDHHDVVNLLIERIHTWVLNHEDLVSGAVTKQAPSWTPRFVDSLVSEKLFREVEKYVRGVRDDPDHKIRIALDDFLTELAHDLQHDPVTMARAEEVKNQIAANPQIQGLVNSIWTSVKATILDATGDPDSVLRRKAADGIAQLGEKLMQDRAFASKIDSWIQDAAGYLANRYSREVAGIIDETVANWDGEATSKKIELLVGRDLQFIRINGTVVGALAGLAIYTVAHNFLG
ncbi:DUF445 domain-containing protein [Nakamurella antarctica]|uniref:DUF445 domain-containing protein n=1 Tax=Nakamurella antarctica TaxID=1902245 RepID=A0A3G8ZQ63_9ACTN|nr:DUF445 domain-containing protein [Nakamurella antarctica]AZI58927.1 DUF445 domain-containing protein [Nakamurella antarctica]